MIPGYCVEGTLAKTILSEPQDVQTMDGRTVPLNLSIHYISFSAHSDFAGTSTFIDKLSPPNVILVHGEKNEMTRLQQALLNRYEGKKIEILTPKNCQTVRLQFRGQKTAKAVGAIASGGPQHLAKMAGLLVQKDYQYTLVDPMELHTYTKLQTSIITQTQSVPYENNWDTLVYQLSLMFEEVTPITEEDKTGVQVHDTVQVTRTSPNHVTLYWVSNPVNDLISDSIVAIILQLSQNPTSFQVEKQKSQEENDQQRLIQIERHLASHFGNDSVVRNTEKKIIKIIFDGTEALYKFDTKLIECADEQLKEQLEELMKYIHGAVFPIKERHDKSESGETKK